MGSKRNFVRAFAKQIGMDGAIAYSSLSRVFQAFAGVINIFFIATFLTGEEQGFYYTFGSILAIQVFFELGFTGIMTQYVAHESAYLKLDDNNEYQGAAKYKSRLAYLVRFCVKWYALIAIVFFVVVNVVGIFYFNKFGQTQEIVVWKLPWLLLSLSTAIKLFQSPFTAIFTGLGWVKEMNKITMYQNIVVHISVWIMLACGLKLYVVGIASTLGIITWFVYVFATKLWKVFVILFRSEITETISYMKEIFPYQWKIAISWVSGYFTFQLFNPVLFATEGPVIAGQMGMTLSVLSSIQALAMGWQNTKVPRYSVLIELKQYDELDRLFNITLKQMAFVCGTLLVIMFGGVWFLRITEFSIGNSLLSDRFLDYIPLLLMIIPVFLQSYVGSWATYLRCHKKEPFLVNSICGGIACLASTFILGNLYGVYGVTIGYCIIQILFFPWGYYIFKTKKAQWH